MVKDDYFKNSKKIIFAVPGSKVFISKYYKNKPNSFLNISLTGPNCQLLCKHCKGLLLKDMIDISYFDMFNSNIRLQDTKNNSLKKQGVKEIKYLNQYIKGVLFSGGFDKNGQLPLDNNTIEKIKYIQKNIKTKINKDAKFYMHLGFISQEQVQTLKQLDLDGVFVNVIFDEYVIRNIYNLKDKTAKDFYENIKILKKINLKVSPHIIIGLNEGKINKEFETIEKLSELNIDSIVFAVAKNLYKTHNFTSFSTALNINKQDFTNENTDEKQAYQNLNLINKQFNLINQYISRIIEIFNYAKKTLPSVSITLGCARPPGIFSENLEIKLLKNAINVISFPSDNTIQYAIDKKYDFKFEELCCALLNWKNFIKHIINWII